MYARFLFFLVFLKLYVELGGKIFVFILKKKKDNIVCIVEKDFEYVVLEELV